MKKAFSAISVLLACLLLFGAFGFAAAAEGTEPEFREIATFVFSLDNQKTTGCVFLPGLPNAPYIDPVDYLSTIYTGEFSQSRKEDGTFSVAAPSGTMEIDVENNIVSFADFEAFPGCEQNKEGSSLNVDFVDSDSAEYIGEFKGLTLDLGKYGIDIIEYNGKAYMPLVTICVIFSHNYNDAEYVGDKIYYVHSMDDMTKDGYFDKSPVYAALERSEEEAEFTYANICFMMDRFYGKPTNAEIAKDVAEKGFEAALEEYDEKTKLAKEKLKSTDVCDYMAALCLLATYFNDGGHTSFYMDQLAEVAQYKDSAFAVAFLDRFQNSNDVLYTAAKQSVMEVSSSGTGRNTIINTRKEKYSEYEPALSWEDGLVYLLVEGDTAVFVFDSFKPETVPEYRAALEYAAENGVKNFIIDLSCNGGGLSATLYYMMYSMTVEKLGSGIYASRSLNTATGNVKEARFKFDLNLDGTIDDKDKEADYDFNFAVLTSRYSFSCGNLLPVHAKEYGIAVFGEVSGGGACSIARYYLSDSHYIFMSGCTKFVVESGADVDLGAPVDCDLTAKDESGAVDYSGFYDIARLGELVEDFYTCDEHVPGEAVRENVNDPGCETEGSYDEVVYCTVCGEELSRETKKTEPLGHDFGEWTETKTPTATENGEKTHTCARCGATETEDIPATGHPQTGDGSETLILVLIALISACGVVVMIPRRIKARF